MRSIIIQQIKELYPDPKCELDFKNNYQLIVAVILSAQCTDKRVNKTTPILFEKYPNFVSLASANIDDIINIIRPCGFFNNKAKNLINMAKDVVDRFNGNLPAKKSDLISLAGVGEKTANVVVSMAYGEPAIAVDTHVFRVSNRLGLANAKNVKHTQHQIEKKVDKQDWIQLHYALVLHGRYICKAIKPNCDNCGLFKNCKYYKNKIKNSTKIIKKVK